MIFTFNAFWRYPETEIDESQEKRNQISGNNYHSGISEVDYFEWDKIWGGDNDDFGTGVAVDKEGNIYIVGGTTSFGPDTPAYYNVFLTKYNSSGAQQWNRTWGGNNDDYSWGVAVDKTGNIYIVGETNSFGLGLPQSNAFLVKYNSSGVQQWNQTWGGNNADYGWGVAVDPEGNAYIVGETNGFGIGIPNFNAFLAKYDSSGAQQWNRTWGGNNDDYGWGVAVDAEGNAYIVGETNSFGPGIIRSNAFLVKYDNLGAQQWNRTWGGDDSECGNGVAVDAEGNAYISGWTYSFEPNSNVFLVKYDNSGSQQWISIWGGDNNDYGNGVAVDAVGNAYITGWTYSFGPSTPDYSNDFLVKYDNSGLQQWNSTWGGENHDYGNGVALDAKCNVYIVGWTRSFGSGIPACDNAFLVKYRLVPGPFKLYTDAGNPDNDGWFILNWGTSKDADNYSVFVYNSCISEINQRIPILEEGMTRRSYALLGLHSGNYYFAIAAYNVYGYTISNCVEIVVLIPACGEEDGDDGGRGNSGGDGSVGVGNGGDGSESSPETALPLLIYGIGVPLVAAGSIAGIIVLLKKKASITQ